MGYFKQNNFMKFKSNINIKLIVLLFLSLVAFIYSTKFCGFLADKRLYAYFLFSRTNHYSEQTYMKMIYDFPIYTLHIRIIYFASSLFGLLGCSLILLRKNKKNFLNVVFITILYLILHFSNLLDFESTRFYNILPLSLFGSAYQLYLILNGLGLFTISLVVLILIFSKRFNFKLMKGKRMQTD